MSLALISAVLGLLVMPLTINSVLANPNYKKLVKLHKYKIHNQLKKIYFNNLI